MAETTEEAQRELADIEKSLKGLITQIENSCMDNSNKCPLVADLEEMLDEVHHLVPVTKKRRALGVITKPKEHRTGPVPREVPLI